MIFYWFAKMMRDVVWLFRIPSPRDVAKIEPDSKCPVCGAESGTIQCVLTLETIGNNESRDITSKPKEIVVKHECKVCGARWFEKPVIAVTPATVMPSKDAEWVRV